MILFGYDFKNEQLITTALTHSSYANEHGIDCNERMEFLGDSVLSLSVSRYIYEQYPHFPEGRLSKIRANAVCEHTLAMCAEEINLGSHIRLGRGEEATGGRTRPSVLSDAFESVIAAIYLDGGFEAARNWILPKLTQFIDDAAKCDNCHDNKTMLQEKSQSAGLGVPTYKVVGESGPDHKKTFTVMVTLGVHSVTADGHSKKAAESEAAGKLLKKLGDLK